MTYVCVILGGRCGWHAPAIIIIMHHASCGDAAGEAHGRASEGREEPRLERSRCVTGPPHMNQEAARFSEDTTDTPHETQYTTQAHTAQRSHHATHKREKFRERPVWATRVYT